jgi:hypothetical protein
MKNHIEAPRALARRLYPAPGRCGWNPGAIQVNENTLTAEDKKEPPAMLGY